MISDIEAQYGVSYRRLDLWTRQGHIRASNPAPGSGHRRVWAAAELDIARRMAELTAAGMTVAASAQIARNGGWPPPGASREAPHPAGSQAGWRDRALCAKSGRPEVFYPGKGENSTAARAVCRACPVRPACLEDAIGRNERFGIWGGKSTPQRDVIARRRLRNEEAA